MKLASLRGGLSSAVRRRDGTVLVVDPSAEAWLVVSTRRRPWDGLLARLRAATLDEELSAGFQPDIDRRRSIRAEMLVTRKYRLALARGWENVVLRADLPSSPWDPRPPLDRVSIVAAKNELDQLIAALRRAAPVPPQGVAMANLLLTDGRGPLYTTNCVARLKTAVRAAIQGLQPET